MPSTQGDLAATLANAMGNSLPLDEYRRLLPGFLAGLRAAECTNEHRIAQFIAQCGHESGGLRYRTELADGWAYEGRADLQNTEPGDGPRFRGHGYLQITGRGHHAAVSEWAHANGLVDTPTWFVDNPEDLASEAFAAIGASWYWVVARDLNAPSDVEDHETCCRLINGGLNGYDDRVARYNNALPLAPQFLPAVLDSGDDFMAALNDDEQRELLDLLRRVAALLGARR